VADTFGVRGSMRWCGVIQPQLPVARLALPRLALLSLLFVFRPAWAEDSMRCGSRLVASEMTTGAVLAACGEPSYRDTRPQLDPGLGLPTELWYYDRGPNQLVRVLSIRDDQVEKIETDGYGFGSGASPQRCQPRQLAEGISKYHLLHDCGEPVSKRVENQLSPYPYNQSTPIYRDRYGRPVRGSFLAPVYREVWTYNFGSRYFLYRVTLENGVVARIENEDQRGY